MIKKNAETGNLKTSFKKFSDMGNKDKDKENPSHEVLPDENADLPGNPNLPLNSTKQPRNASTRYMRPLPDEQNYKQDEFSNVSVEQNVNEDKKVKIYGKVAKLPKGTNASKGFNFLENIKISKNSIWYMIIERQDNELQCVKYNHKKGVDLSKFVNELKNYYKVKYQNNNKVCRLIESIEISGNDKYSSINNIPLIEIDGKKIITKITEDLIKLLSK